MHKYGESGWRVTSALPQADDFKSVDRSMRIGDGGTGGAVGASFARIFGAAQSHAMMEAAGDEIRRFANRAPA